MKKVFTAAESQALLLIADALDGDRLHEEVTDFSARTLSLASGVHPHLLEYVLDWLGCFRVKGYRRSMEHLRGCHCGTSASGPSPTRGTPGAAAGPGPLCRRRTSAASGQRGRGPDRRYHLRALKTDDGLCKDCPEPSRPSRSRCEGCSEKRRVRERSQGPEEG